MTGVQFAPGIGTFLFATTSRLTYTVGSMGFPSSTKVKNVWSHTSTPTICHGMVLCLKKAQGKLYLYLYLYLYLGIGFSKKCTGTCM